MSGVGIQGVRFTLLAGSLALAGGAVAQQSGVPDAQIEANVLRALAGAPELSTQNIQSSTVYGTVTLSGNVHDEAMRTKAENLVARAPGVKKVVDELTLGDAPANGDQAQADSGQPGPDQPGTDQSNGGYAPAPSQSSEQAMNTAPVPPNQEPGQQPAYNQQQAPQGQPSYGPPQAQDNGQYPPQYQAQQPYGAPQQGQPSYGPPQPGQPGYAPQGQPSYGPPQQGQYPDQAQQYPGQPQTYPGQPQPYPGQQPYGQAPAPGQPPYGSRPTYQQYPPQGYYPPQGGQQAGLEVTVPAGALLRIRINRGLDSNHIQPGAPFDGTVLSDISANGAIAIPRGAAVQGTVVDAKKAGALKGQGELGLQITSVILGGNSYPIQTEVWQREGRDKSTTTVNSALGVGALGAIIGGIAGGGAGAAVGAGVGAGVGVAGAAGSPGGRVVIPPETVLTFHVAQPAVVRTVSQQEMARLAYAAGQPYGQPQPRPMMRRYYSPYYGYYYAPYPYAR